MPGAYKIKCEESNKVYIGYTSKSFKERIDYHFGYLRKNKHPNYKLQNDYNKYGENSFVFEILEEVFFTDKDALKLLENIWTTKYINAGFNLYNIKNVDKYINKEEHPMFGRKHSEKTKKEWSKKRAGTTIPEERKKKISNSTKELNNPRAKLTEKDCLEIKELLLNADTSKLWYEIEAEISAVYNISSSQIAKIRKGIHWSNKTLLKGGYKNWIEELK